MKSNKISVDTLYSTWVFIWAVLFYLTRKAEIPLFYEYWNPSAALLVALSYQIFTIIVVLLEAKKNILKILVIITFIIVAFKAGPFLLLWTPTISWKNSILAGTALFCVYYVYIRMKGLTIISIYKELTDAFVNDEILERLVILPNV